MQTPTLIFHYNYADTHLNFDTNFTPSTINNKVGVLLIFLSQIKLDC